VTAFQRLTFDGQWWTRAPRSAVVVMHEMERKFALRLLRLPAVMQMAGLSRSSIYLQIKDGRLPAQVDLGGRAVAWVEQEVLQWASDRIAESRNITPRRVGAERG